MAIIHSEEPSSSRIRFEILAQLVLSTNEAFLYDIKNVVKALAGKKPSNIFQMLLMEILLSTTSGYVLNKYISK